MLRLVSTVWNSLPSFVRTADSFTSFSSQLDLHVCKSLVTGPLSAPVIPFTGSFARYKFVAYLLTYEAIYPGSGYMLQVCRLYANGGC